MKEDLKVDRSQAIAFATVLLREQLAVSVLLGIAGYDVLPNCDDVLNLNRLDSFLAPEDANRAIDLGFLLSEIGNHICALGAEAAQRANERLGRDFSINQARQLDLAAADLIAREQLEQMHAHEQAVRNYNSAAAVPD